MGSGKVSVRLDLKRNVECDESVASLILGHLILP